ncbi:MULTISPECIES: hypothetical protein [unclassified Paenibacillus]|uniref:hypothetical protein n=1 Tax=unclassified Paenibacillus TaxID=185978 RepID=UPI001AE3D5B8|nr:MULTISPECIES: hypothetical protein [unclassified Paenibacillus]MBP1153649.1 hypothetical protein [Paenibacillus sp. PvP091]MBP1170966.1 hypothetical protein [Paenibacillus sp. PvR098]MBP2441994.1 hypothetical protein [Paenibacillus sp. PvP052]
MVEDFKQKCLHYGYSLAPYYKFLHAYALSKGSMDEAAADYGLWKKAKCDALSDCRACDQHSFGTYHFLLEQHKRGLSMLNQIFEGKLGCAEIPHSTYSFVLLPLLEIGDWDRAVLMAKKGI